MSIVIVTLSFVITLCGVTSIVCCFKLTTALTLSTKGKIMLRPAYAVNLYLPKRSIIFTSDCLTTLIEAAATNKQNKSKRIKINIPIYYTSLNYGFLTKSLTPSIFSIITLSPTLIGFAFSDFMADQSSPFTFT